MAIFKPFSSIRPDAAYASETLCPPYDVVSREEAAAASQHPHSFMHVIRADAEFPPEQNDSEEVYLRSRQHLDRFLSDGIYREDDRPHFYIYSETMNGRTQTGLVGCASIDEYESGIIKRHEVTRSAKEQDRIRHFAACEADTEPVFLMYKDNNFIRQMTQSIMESFTPEYETTDEAGVLHRLWVVERDIDCEKLEQAFSGVSSLYIADGHHRTASAVKVGHRKREEYGTYTGEEEFNRFMAVAFPESQLEVLPYHRLIHDLGGLTQEQLLEQLTKCADVTGPYPSCPDLERHSAAVYLPGAWYRFRFHSRLIDESDPIHSLDVDLLQQNVLEPLLKIHDPRRDPRLSFLGGTESIEQMISRVNSGKEAAAFALHPVSVREIMDVADAGQVMPPKSTWFEPKIGSGWFLHSIR